VFGNPWDSEADMFACYAAVSFIIPLLLWGGGKLMGAIFDFSSHWRLGLFIAAAIVGAAGFMTVVGRVRSSLSVDILAISAWVILGLVVAPVVGLAPSRWVALACYGAMLLAILVYVLVVGRWKAGFLRTLSWPVTWTLLAALFAFSADRLVLYS
jgi:hypothetical protein